MSGRSSTRTEPELARALRRARSCSRSAAGGCCTSTRRAARRRARAAQGRGRGRSRVRVQGGRRRLREDDRAARSSSRSARRACSRSRSPRARRSTCSPRPTSRSPTTRSQAGACLADSKTLVRARAHRRSGRRKDAAFAAEALARSRRRRDVVEDRDRQPGARALRQGGEAGAEQGRRLGAGEAQARLRRERAADAAVRAVGQRRRRRSSRCRSRSARRRHVRRPVDRTLHDPHRSGAGRVQARAKRGTDAARARSPRSSARPRGAPSCAVRLPPARRVASTARRSQLAAASGLRARSRCRFEVATVATVLAAVARRRASRALLANARFPGRDLVDVVVDRADGAAADGARLLRAGRARPPQRHRARVRGASSARSIVFTRTGAVVAATVGALPLVVKAARAALEGVDPTLVRAARTLGAGPLRAFFTVQLPLAGARHHRRASCSRSRARSATSASR